jgi:hypothetical protein
MTYSAKSTLINKLIKFMYREDYGNNYYVQVLNIKKWSLFQTSVSWNDFGMLYLQITMGSNGLFGFMLCLGKFGIDFDILSRTYSFDYYLKNEDI